MQLSGPKYALQAEYGFIAVPGIQGCNEADIPCEELYSQYDDEDQRKFIIFSKEFVSPTNGQTYYTPIPVYHSHWEDGETVAGNSDANTYVLRYSDALMLYAEALNEKITKIRMIIAFLSMINNNSFWIFDDIYWSKEMQEAWLEIKNHPKVTVTIDVFHFGIVFFREEQAKEHFKIRV